MFRLMLATALVLTVTAVNAGEFQGLASGLLAVYAKPLPPGPTPTPPTPVTDACDNCGGTGKLGDGTVFVVCPDCNGTGKKTTAEEPVAMAERGYAKGPEGCPCNCPDCICPRDGGPARPAAPPTTKSPPAALTSPPAGYSLDCSSGSCRLVPTTTAPAAPRYTAPQRRGLFRLRK